MKFKSNVWKIIREEFDTRCDAMVISYLMSKGIEFCEKLTEEDIAKVEGNGLMTQDFVQSMIRCASRIAKECSLFDEILPFIAERFGVDEDE